MKTEKASPQPILVTLRSLKQYVPFGTTKQYELIERGVIKTIKVDGMRLVRLQETLDAIAEEFGTGSRSQPSRKQSREHRAPGCADQQHTAGDAAAQQPRLETA